MGKQPDVVMASHLQWELVCQEGAHQVAAVASQPQQQEPDGDGTVHVARLARTVVLSARRAKKNKKTILEKIFGYKSTEFSGGAKKPLRK